MMGETLYRMSTWAAPAWMVFLTIRSEVPMAFVDAGFLALMLITIWRSES